MIKDDSVYLKHILGAINKIQEYSKDINYDYFIKNHMVQDAIIRQIEIISEAARRLSDDLKNQNSQIPWKDIIGMRNKLSHDYFGVDVDAVWNTVEKDLPFLKTEIEQIVDR